MRRTWIAFLLSALVTVAPSRATDEPDKEAAAREAPAQTAAKKKTPVAKKPAEKSATEALSAEVEQLRQMMAQQAQQMEAQQKMMREQQEKLNALTEALNAAQTTASSAAAAAKEAKEQQGEVSVVAGQVEAVADATNDLNKKVAALDKDYQGEKKSLGDKIKSIGPFSFSGDLRNRYETFYSGGVQTSPAPQDRNRERFRLRFNVNAKFSDEFSGGFTLSAGDPLNPLSTNQTFTGFYTRKPINIDRAFLTYNPHYLKPFSVTGGKFTYPFVRTEMMWDNDLNVEGLSEQVMFDWKNASFFQHFGVVAFQLPFFENPGGPDSATLGGQVQTRWRLGTDRLKFGAYLSYYDIRNPNPIAAVQPGPSNGVVAGSYAGNNNTNFTGNIGTTVLTRIFASKFGIFDVIGRLDIDTGFKRLPAYILIDFAQNGRACTNIQQFIDAGVTPPFCDKSQRKAYWTEASVGKTQEKGDTSFRYTFAHIGRDAVLSAFNFDDMRQGTNVAQHRVDLFYQAYKNITLGFTGLIGRQLQTASSPTGVVPLERYLKRLQFDVVYKF
jgi:hypothetical protein